MLAVEQPAPSLFRKRSIFRRFRPKDREEAFPPTLASKPIPTREDIRTAPKKLQRRSSLAQPRSTAPLPLRERVNTNTEPPKMRKLPIITHIHRFEIPPKHQPVRDIQEPKPSTDSISLRVLPSAMPTSPFPDHPRISPWDIFLPPSQIFSLYLGFLPQDMAEKWFIYSEGPDQTGKLKVHFHRSWTGMKIAELFVVMDVKGEGAGKIVGIKWNASAETNRMNEEEAKYMIRTSCRWTLGVDLEPGV